MHLNIGQITLIDLIGMLDRKEVVINRDYQRGAGLWPNSARTYFIDTILEGYPFPKLYLYQSFNKRTNRPIKEIIDGQQRVTTIVDFVKNKFSLTNASRNYGGLKYSELTREVQQKFLSYQIEVSTILSATRSELLEMFRRINAYTAPLKEAEKRHSIYQGRFKWFIVELTKELTPVLEMFRTLTPKQISRMADAEFFADLVVVLEKGIVSKQTALIEALYKDYDEDFSNEEYYYQIIYDFFNVLVDKFSVLQDTFLAKSYAIHSLFCAYTLIRYGIPKGEELCDIEPGYYDIDFDMALDNLIEIADAHEEDDLAGKYKEYILASTSSTTQQSQRKIRTKFLVKALINK